MTNQAQVLSVQYKSRGRMLQQDIVDVEFEVEDKIYSHKVPNKGWSVQTPALQSLAAIDIRPSDIQGTKINVEERPIFIPVVWNNDNQQYLITKKVFMLGGNKLAEADWFNANADVYDSDGEQMHGMSIDPGTGNQGKTEIEIGDDE